MDRINKIGLPVVLIIMFSIIGLMKSAVNIGYGEAGVLFKTFGEGTVVDEPALGEGFHLILPWNKVYLYNVKQQEVFESQMQVLSSNGLEIKLEASAWFQPNQEELGKLHQEKGVNYKNRILLPAIRSAARSVVGRYTPEQLYSSKRDAIQTEIYDETKKIVEDQVKDTDR